MVVVHIDTEKFRTILLFFYHQLIFIFLLYNLTRNLLFFLFYLIKSNFSELWKDERGYVTFRLTVLYYIYIEKINKFFLSLL